MEICFHKCTGLYYLQSRYYNPTWGRFINADAFVSTGQGYAGNNMSAYCNNSPANYTDLLGYLPYHNDIIGNRPMMYGSNDSRYETVTIHVTDFSSDPTINAICKNIANEISAFFDAFIELIELGNDLLEVDSFNDLVDVVADIKENQISEDVIGLNRVRAGWNNMQRGLLSLLCLPISLGEMRSLELVDLHMVLDSSLWALVSYLTGGRLING